MADLICTCHDKLSGLILLRSVSRSGLPLLVFDPPGCFFVQPLHYFTCENHCCRDILSLNGISFRLFEIIPSAVVTLYSGVCLSSSSVLELKLFLTSRFELRRIKSPSVVFSFSGFGRIKCSSPLSSWIWTVEFGLTFAR